MAYIYSDIGITHVFSCINNSWVLRKLFKHKADRPSVQTFSEGPGSVNIMKQICVNFIVAYFT